MPVVKRTKYPPSPFDTTTESTPFHCDACGGKVLEVENAVVGWREGEDGPHSPRITHHRRSSPRFVNGLPWDECWEPDSPHLSLWEALGREGKKRIKDAAATCAPGARQQFEELLSRLFKVGFEEKRVEALRKVPAVGGSAA